jgi:hypothetical protein
MPRQPGAALRRSAVVLCGLATVVVVAIFVGFAPVLLAEEPSALAYLVGAPLLAAVLAVVSSSVLAPTRAAVVVLLLGAASVAWSVYTVVALGLFLLLPSLLLLAAGLLLVVRAVETSRGRMDGPDPQKS